MRASDMPQAPHGRETPTVEPIARALPLEVGLHDESLLTGIVHHSPRHGYEGRPRSRPAREESRSCGSPGESCGFGHLRASSERLTDRSLLSRFFARLTTVKRSPLKLPSNVSRIWKSFESTKGGKGQNSKGESGTTVMPSLVSGAVPFTSDNSLDPIRNLGGVTE